MIQELLRHIGQLFTWLIIVAPWEQAIRIRLGHHVRLLRAGWYIRLPFVDRVYRQTIRRRISAIHPQTLTTRDGKTISLTACLGYAIRDVQKLFDTLDQPESTIESEVASMVSDFIATRTLEECTPENLQSHVREKLTLEQYGLSGEEFFLTNFAVVKTFRFITGDLPAWSQGGILDTNAHDGQSDA